MSADRPRILLIARAYPPTVGGMENFAHQLNVHLPLYAQVTSLINHRGKKALPVFLPWVLAAATVRVRRERIDVVHLADALLAPVGAALKLTTGVPVTASVCGLDVTYGNRAYQAAIPAALRRLDMTMPISAATMSAMRERTGASPPARVIPLGVNAMPPETPAAAARLRGLLAVANDRPVLLTVGRLVPRKGVAWFVSNVLPSLPAHVIYAVVGQGPERAAILRTAAVAGVADRLRLLGRVDAELLAAAYARADVFVMPNVPINRDMEGFGLVALEAAASGVPVVAAELEGITDALQDGGNAVLVPASVANGYVRELSRLIDMPVGGRRAIGAAFAAYTRERYGWDRTARLYVEVMGSVLRDGRHQHVPGAAIEER